MATLKQKGPKLKLGDLVRIQDEGREGELAVVVEDDGHKEYPWCCMTVTDREEMRVECWPEKYDRIGNVVEMVALGQEAGQLVKAVRKLVRGSSHGAGDEQWEISVVKLKPKSKRKRSSHGG